MDAWLVPEKVLQGQQNKDFSSSTHNTYSQFQAVKLCRQPLVKRKVKLDHVAKTNSGQAPNY